MKRLLGAICFCMALLIQPFSATPVAACADVYLSVSELREQTPGRWTDSLVADSGAVIRVDCPVEVPDAERGACSLCIVVSGSA